MKQMILLKGTEGGGKSLLMNKCSTGYRIKEVGRFSQHALDYTDFSKFEVLLLKELGTMDDETQGISTLKFLSSEDQGYTVEITGPKDEETGRFTTLTYTIPAMTMLSSTTRIEIDKQLERRAWLFNVDETDEQTKKILAFKAKMELQEAEKDLGLRKVTDSEFATEVIKRYIEGYQPIKIINPFITGLSQSLGAEKLRVRGDIKKLFSFIIFYAMFNIKRLIRIDSGIYLLTPAVLFEALQNISPTMTKMVCGLDERALTIIRLLKEMDITDVKDRIGKSERDILAVKIGKSERVVRNFLSNLESAGYISSQMDGRTKSHVLLYDLSSIKKKYSGNLVISTLPKSFMEEMLKEAQKWLERASGNWKSGSIVEIFSQSISNMLAGIPDKLEDIPDMPLKYDDSHESVKEKNILPYPLGYQLPDGQQSLNQASIEKTSVDNLEIKKLPSYQTASNKSASIPALKSASIPAGNENITVPVFEGETAAYRAPLPQPIDLSTYKEKEYPCPECAAKGHLVLFMDRHKLEAHRNEHGIFDRQICDACGKLGTTTKVGALHLCVDCEPKDGEN